MEWHRDYEVPGTSLSRRLDLVRSRLIAALERAGSSPAVLSLCAGDGRDVITVLKDRPSRVGRAVLVELDPTLADRGRRAAEAAGLTALEVRGRDAGAVESFIDVLPVDVLLLCGIFGNVEHAQVANIVSAVPCMLKQGGSVIWTRGGSKPDHRAEIRRWFTESGLEEIAFDGEPEPFGVGLNRMTGPSRPAQDLPASLFRFS